MLPSTPTIDGVPIVVPNQQQPRTTKFLIEMDRELGRDPFAMDKFAKTPIAKEDLDDIFANATVTPL